MLNRRTGLAFQRFGSWLSRFAILGAGRSGQVHARTVNGNEKAVLAAVFDPVAGLRRSGGGNATLLKFAI